MESEAVADAPAPLEEEEEAAEPEPEKEEEEEDDDAAAAAAPGKAAEVPPAPPLSKPLLTVFPSPSAVVEKAPTLFQRMPATRSEEKEKVAKFDKVFQMERLVHCVV